LAKSVPFEDGDGIVGTDSGSCAISLVAMVVAAVRDLPLYWTFLL
jgi:hypothetical protein